MSAPPSPGRLLFVDWLRAWALLVMIETHVFNAFLDASLRSAAWFGALNFVNGLVAPSFLFVSGFVLLVATQKRLKDLRTFGLPFWRQMRRVAVVSAVGYAMHLPTYALWRLPRVSPDESLWFVRADILHCISATWLFLILSLIAIRSESWQRWWFVACAAALSAFAPLVWSVEFRPTVPAPLAAYFNVKTGSLFPLFPWSAFMLAGAACGSWFLSARRAARERQFMWIVAVVGAAWVITGRFAAPFGFLPQAAQTDWWADPRTLLLRLGIVLLLLCVCYLYGLWRQPLTSPLLDVSRESLFVYVAHLLVIYGPFLGGRSLADAVGQRLGPAACAVASLALAVLMIAGARFWGPLKQKVGGRI